MHHWKKKVNRRNLAFVVIGLLFAIGAVKPGFAQEDRTIYLRVASTDTSGTTPVLLATGPYAGKIANLSNAMLVMAENKKQQELFDTPLGTAMSVYKNDSVVVFTYELSNSFKARGAKVGDLIKVDLRDSVFHPKHLTGHILSLQLLLQSQYREDFFNFNALGRKYMANPDAADAWLLDTIYQDLKDFYLNNKSMLAGETFTKPFPKGFYKGKNVQQVFESLTPDDVAQFLWFMISFPGKYIGVPYKINETFATWLINDAPGGGMQVINYFEKAKGDSSTFVKLMKAHPSLLTEKGIAYNAATGANLNRYWSKAMAEKQYKAIFWHGQLSGDMRGTGLLYLYMAEDYQNAQNYPLAFEYCQRSEKIYTALNNYDRLLDLYFKQSFLYYNTASYDSSFLQLAKVQNILTRYIDSCEDYTPESGWSKYYDYSAYTYYKSGRYKEALGSIDSSIAILKVWDSPKALRSFGYNYTLQGNIYKTQTLYDKALDAYREAANLYQKAGDFSVARGLVNDIAILYFKQGNYSRSNELLQANLSKFLDNDEIDNAGLSYSQMGQNYWNLKQYDSAIICHEKAIALRQKAANKSGQAFSWEQLGTLYQKAGIKNKALAALDSAAVLYESIGKKAELAEILIEAGKVYNNDKESTKAESYYRRAADALASLGKTGSYADALFELGLITMKDKPLVSEKYLDSCRLLSLAAGLQAQAAYAMMNLGSIAKSAGKLTAGKNWYEQARTILEALQEPHALALYYRSLGFDAEWDLNLDSANRCYQRAISTFDSTDKAIALQLMSSIAYNYQSMGRYADAEKLLDEVIRRSREGKFLLEQGSAFQSKSWMLLQQGLTEHGLALADSAAHLYELSGNSNRLASIYALRGDFNRKLFNFKEAYQWYVKSDSIYAAEKNGWYQSAGMINFVVLFYYQGDYQKSLDYTYKALATRPFLLEDQTYVDLQAALAENFYYLGKIDSCMLLITKYLPLAQNKKLVRAQNWLSLLQGRLLVDQQQYKQAIALLTIATSPESAKNDLIIYQQALGYLGRAYSGIQQKDSAAHYFNLAIATAKTFEIPSFSWEALYFAGLDAYEREDYTKAVPLFKEAVALVNKQASNLYGGEEAGKLFKQQATKANLYFKLMSALTKTGQKEEAWQYANLSQAAAVSDLAGGLSAELGNPEKKKVLEEAQTRFQQLQSVGNALQESKKDSLGKAGQIVALEKTRAIAEEEYLNYIMHLEKDFPELGTFFANQVNPENFRNLHTYLPEDMAMLMYVVNDQELMIFWATQDNTGIVTGTIPANFFNTTEAWIAALKNPQRPAGAGPLVLRTQIGKVPNRSKPTLDVKAGAEQLFELLISPILPAIAGKKSWCIIPNGRLTHLPFHAMGNTKSDGTFEYLAATKNIFYTNKPNEMFLPWNRRNRANFAAFGNPDNTLEKAGDEATQIAKSFNTSNLYTQGAATIDKATQSLTNMHYVHFATHGVLSYQDFDSSYLVFAPGADQPNGGKLTLYDIRRLNIKGCDLVTLSACETAVSAEIAKGWYISPANAFLINRVRSVVASLWEVDDESTSLLMQYFYKHLQTMPKALALRQAMADVSAMPQYEHPFYWAGFVLYGDWQ